MDWNHWRREFPITEERVHLNHAGVSPISRRVAAAITRFTEQALHLSPPLYQGWDTYHEQVRASCAALIGARANEIGFVKNTSEAISLIAAGFSWRQGDNVIALDGEYPSNVYPWWNLRRLGVETRMVASERGMASIDRIAAAIDGRTRIVAVSFVDWNSGARSNLTGLAELCHQRGVLLCVDGIQGVGALAIDVEAMGIDCLAVGGHKWLLAPEGCGIVYVSSRVVDQFESVLHGWKSVSDSDTYLPYHFNPRPDASKFEPGSPPQLGTQALGAAVEMLLEIGVANIESRLLYLTDYVANQLRNRGAEILSPWGEGERSGIVVFRFADDPAALAESLSNAGFIVRSRGGGVRLAPHFYINEDDMDRLIAELRRLGH